MDVLLLGIAIMGGLLGLALVRAVLQVLDSPALAVAIQEGAFEPAAGLAGPEEGLASDRFYKPSASVAPPPPTPSAPTHASFVAPRPSPPPAPERAAPPPLSFAQFAPSLEPLRPQRSSAESATTAQAPPALPTPPMVGLKSPPTQRLAPAPEPPVLPPPPPPASSRSLAALVVPATPATVEPPSPPPPAPVVREPPPPAPSTARPPVEALASVVRARVPKRMLLKRAHEIEVRIGPNADEGQNDPWRASLAPSAAELARVRSIAVALRCEPGLFMVEPLDPVTQTLDAERAQGFWSGEPQGRWRFRVTPLRPGRRTLSVSVFATFDVGVRTLPERRFDVRARTPASAVWAFVAGRTLALAWLLAAALIGGATQSYWLPAITALLGGLAAPN